MGFEIDVPGAVSDDLHTVIAFELNNPDARRPPTLGSVRQAMDEGVVGRLIQRGDIGADQERGLFDEIEALIEQYGPDVLAQDFMRYRAGDTLATVIQAELNREDRDQPPTLRTVAEAVQAGLVARLVAAGEIDPDEDETLTAEIDWMIRRYGPDAPAEEFLP
ncbi:MAG: hypothetical protein GWO16_10225 [Gammaproteobacteria bacterium]|nr:hypothetical protein [Gammaproteobacteria bacterium]NIR98287.1 hypothetical protein [Gammaproteobacteria bacterium]NIT64034.1 hypothetical protein [Gammaproteobacteria bacterium]NIV20965.1 hypothetical protein [Gammaproteobacteria bacterium]NIX10363.1 hypothetical protein [Gammaproteobacteria bacterium]